MASKKPAQNIPAKLTETEQDLLWHMEHGYQLITDSLSSDPVLKRLKDNEVIRPTDANRNTVKGLQERGLITQGKSQDPLTIVWTLSKRKKQSSHAKR